MLIFVEITDIYSFTFVLFSDKCKPIEKRGCRPRVLCVATYIFCLSSVGVFFSISFSYYSFLNGILRFQKIKITI